MTGPMPVDRVVVTLGPAAPAMRRRLAPLAWCALETVFERALMSDVGLVADVSVRAVADDLGVAKNTALRALKALRSAGLVEHAQIRGEGGRFDGCIYRLTVPDEVLTRQPLSLAAAVRSSRRPKSGVGRRAAASSAGRSNEQLVLLPFC